MKFARVFASAAILSLAAAGAGQAATLRNADEPAEFPPASYKGMQYVDSRGCVYIRAGIDGNVTWVPRVTRGRKQVCGAQPTFAKSAAHDLPVIADAPAAAAPAKPAAAPKPVKTATAAPKPVTAAPKPVTAAPKPVTVVRKPAPAPKPATNRAPMKTIASLFTPPKMVKPVRPAPQARPAAKPAPVQAAAGPSCDGISMIGRKHMTGTGLRCGPQAESPVGAAIRGNGQRRVAAMAPTSVPVPAAAPAPRRVQAAAAPAKPQPLFGRAFDNPPVARTVAPIPEGYRPIWQDDRLNPYRGNRTADGRAQMDLVWTQTVPRQLIERASGRDVTRLHPNLRYPFTDLTTQVQTDAQAAMAAASAQSSGVVSTKSKAPAKSAPAQQASGQTYVQVGTFGVPDNAHNTAQRLQQAGLPVRVLNTTRKGKAYQIVLAGPFAGPGAQTALGTVRKAGFRDAFLRR
ncbi:SPOR domain-containing protein [Thalassovita mangrovi]|uniref:SPOR domain-containing protein n=1 Tax=Thalassovita mangrovi TaxID=2692236 RepID=A0A6L8LVV2_9RHOB|nr:SPOR domain-containing protein [Thalassovita mangrovi]MYM57442.1 hypothetical protein [Thalassovita mangrovi]